MAGQPWQPATVPIHAPPLSAMIGLGVAYPELNFSIRGQLPARLTHPAAEADSRTDERHQGHQGGQAAELWLCLCVSACGGNWHRDFEQSSQDMPAQGIITGQLREPARAHAMGP